MIVHEACRFCGQLIQLEIDAEQEQSYLVREELAVELCNCGDAKGHRLGAKKAKSAMDNVERLLEAAANPEFLELSEEKTKVTLNTLNDCIVQMVDHHYAKVSITLSTGTKIDLSLNGEGFIVSKRTENIQEQYASI